MSKIPKTTDSAHYHLGKLEALANVMLAQDIIDEEIHAEYMQSVEIVNKAIPLPF